MTKIVNELHDERLKSQAANTEFTTPTTDTSYFERLEETLATAEETLKSAEAIDLLPSIA